MHLRKQIEIYFIYFLEKKFVFAITKRYVCANLWGEIFLKKKVYMY